VLFTREAKAEDWCEGGRATPRGAQPPELSLTPGLVRWGSLVCGCAGPGPGGASEDGGRRYCPQRAGRPPGAPAGRALDIQEPNSATKADRACPVPPDARHMLATWCATVSRRCTASR